MISFYYLQCKLIISQKYNFFNTSLFFSLWSFLNSHEICLLISLYTLKSSSWSRPSNSSLITGSMSWDFLQRRKNKMQILIILTTMKVFRLMVILIHCWENLIGVTNLKCTQQATSPPPWFKILNMATRFHIEVTDSSNNEFPSLISTNMFISTNTITNSLNVTIKFCTNHALKIMCLIFWTW